MKKMSFDEIVKLEKICEKTVRVGNFFMYKGILIVKATDDRYILLEDIRLDEINVTTNIVTVDRPKSEKIM